MNEIVITISIRVPDTARVAVTPLADDMGGLASGNGSQYVPPFADELVPLPDGVPATYPGDVAAQPVVRGAATAVAGRDFCPVHRVPWKTVPGGISRKTGKPYDSFVACPERGCDQRPA